MYSSFKDSSKFESYLTIMPDSLRIPYFQFRTGNHRFPVETGRWRQSFVRHEDRKCLLCSTNEIGDEFHYLLICPYFSDTRAKYIPPKYRNRPNFIKFKELLTTSSEPRLRKLCIFVKGLLNYFARPLQRNNRLDT